MHVLRLFNRRIRYYRRWSLVGNALQRRFDGRIDLCGFLSGIPRILHRHHPRAGAKRNGCGMRVDIHDRGADIGRIGNNGIGYVSNNGCADCLRGLNELRQGARADGVFSRHMV